MKRQRQVYLMQHLLGDNRNEIGENMSLAGWFWEKEKVDISLHKLAFKSSHVY